jgi:hypothetical protein
MTTQQFKNQTLTRTKVKNNILKIWNLTSKEDQYDWYQEALSFAIDVLTPHVDIFKKNNWSKELSINKACGIISALSPLKTWSQNKSIALDLIITNDCGHINSFKQKALDIINSNGTDEEILAILKGRKISSFYLNIRYPQKAENVTIDRHALSVALGKWITEDDYRGITHKQYEFFKQCYILAAEKLEVSPLLVQSATWVKWRQIKKEY